jgi:hypothetical protein
VAGATSKQKSDKGVMHLVRFDRPIADRNAKAQDKITGQVSEPVEMARGDCDRVEEGVLKPAYRTYLEAREGLAEVFKEGARPAYLNYIDARKGLAEAFKQRVRQDKEICKDAEWRYQLCESAIEMAIKVREKGELDALDVYREDVNKAVNKASKAYKDKMEQLRIECKQRVMDAWRGSMETSTRIAGVFEQDRNMKRPQDKRLQFPEMILDLKRRFLTGIKRVVHGRTAYVSSQQCTRDSEVNTRTTL